VIIIFLPYFVLVLFVKKRVVLLWHWSDVWAAGFSSHCVVCRQQIHSKGCNILHLSKHLCFRVLYSAWTLLVAQHEKPAAVFPILLI